MASKTEEKLYMLPPTGDALISDKQVAAALGSGVSTVWHWARHDPTFPRPIRLGGRCTRFSVAAVRQFIALKAGQNASGVTR